MAHQEKFLSIPLKSFLILVAIIFAIAASTLALSFSLAQTGSNTTPDSAITLSAEGNTGSLEPGEQHWYTFTPEGVGVEQSLMLEFSPGDSNTANFVNLSVFGQNQIIVFSQDDTSTMAGTGASQLLSATPESGVIVWSGTVSEPTVYYVQVLNDSDFPIAYTLSGLAASGDLPAEAEPSETADTDAEPPAEAEAPTAGPLPMVGTDPGNPDELISGDVARGTVAPNSTYWYTFTLPKTGNTAIQDLNYTMFFTPDDGNRKHRVNFELFEYSEFDKWQRGTADEMNNFGAGMLVDRDGDYNTGERAWGGSVTKGDKYLLSISNGNDIPMDFWLFDDDIINPILGPIPAPAPAPVFAQGAAPQTALPLDFNAVNKGGLEPGEEAWYSFRVTDFDNEFFEEVPLTMITTPDDGNRIRQMVFDVFTAQGARDWSPGDNSRIQNVGAGSVVYRDNNTETGERFWKGWVIDNELYYVQVRNGTDEHMDYWLFTDDIYGVELGEPQEIIQQTFEPGRSPGTAVPMAEEFTTTGQLEGQLQPGQEQWYTFSRGVSGAGRVETIYTMFFTPDDGNRIRSVTFELFEGNQLRDWAPDNPDGIGGFGKGSVVSRDGGVETGELLWKGHVISGDTYYLRILNGSDVPIDFTVFTDDVITINTN